MPRPALLLPESAVLKGVLALAPLFDVTLRRQNTGAMPNPAGRLVRFGEPGASDLIGFAGPSWGAKAGVVLAVEVKREGWSPPSPKAKARRRWERQLARLREVNEAGGFGFWVDHPANFEKVVKSLRTGRCRVAFGAQGEMELEELR
jgi:hypothetical protein